MTRRPTEPVMVGDSHLDSAEHLHAATWAVTLILVFSLVPSILLLVGLWQLIRWVLA